MQATLPLAGQVAMTGATRGAGRGIAHELGAAGATVYVTGGWPLAWPKNCACMASLARTESPRYLGRAVAALAGDPLVMDKSGGVHRVADLARAYGFTDTDGRQVEAFEM